MYRSEPTAMYRCSFCSLAIVAQDGPGTIICTNCENWQGSSGHKHFSLSGSRTNNIDGIYIEAGELIPGLETELGKLGELEANYQDKGEIEKVNFIKLQRDAVLAAIDLCHRLANSANKSDNQKTTKICQNCSAQFDDENMRFCLNCGRTLDGQIVPDKPQSDKILNCEFEFKCPLSWENLQKLENSDVRFCSSCEKNVYFAHSQNELDKLANEGKCVAFNPTSANDNSQPEDGGLLKHIPSSPPLMGMIMLPDKPPLEIPPPPPLMGMPAPPPKKKKSKWKFWK